MKRGSEKKALFVLCAAVLCVFMQAADVQVPGTVQAAEAAPVVIMLDPGHGGENCGSIYLVESASEVLEKELTLTLAQLLQEELQKQPGIEVYLTRSEDAELELKQRAQMAQDAGAALLISLHFNDSGEHRYYGTETWVSGQKEYYEEGFRLGLCLEQELKALGLHSRGIKTRLLENGKADYYGIIREGVKREINTVLVEHCFVDHEKDKAYWQKEMKQLAEADAKAIFSYLAGKNSDKTRYPAYFRNGDTDWEVRGADNTPPEGLRVEQKLLEEEWTFLLQAKDPQSKISYYDYSLDGGKNWSELQPWSREYACKAHVPLDEQAKAIWFRVYNAHGCQAESAAILLAHHEPPPETAEAVEVAVTAESWEPKTDHRIWWYLAAGAGAAVLLLVGIGWVMFGRFGRYKK